MSLMLMLINYVETMVIPALPKIQEDFSTTATTVAWITTAYLIVGAVASPIFGKLGDRYGKKRMYVISVAFYIVAVGIAGFSPSILFLIFARAVQGLGYAVFPIAIAIITDLFPRERVAQAQGILSGTLAIGPALGLLIGSYIVQDLGWQAAFHTAFIFSLIVFVISLKYLPHIESKTMERIDYPGALTLMVTIVSFLVYLSDGPNYGWWGGDQSLLVLTSLIGFVSFLVVEYRSKEPLMRFSLFKVRNIMVANVAGLISGVAMFLMFLGVVYYSQLPPPYGLGLSIIDSGLLMAPVALTMVVFGPLAGRIVQKRGPRPSLILGSILGMLGFTLMVFHRADAFDVVTDTLVVSSGIIMIIVPLVNAVATALPEDSRAVGIGMNTLIRTIGSAIGPVVESVLMDSYKAWDIVTINGRIVDAISFPSSTAFDLIFTVGIVSIFLTLLVSLGAERTTRETGQREEVKTPQATV